MTSFPRLAAVLLLCGIVVSLGAGGGGVLAGNPPPESSAPQTSTLDSLLEKLRRQYPDRESVTENAQQIADQLLECSRMARVDPEGPPVAGRAAILAAEVLFQGGRTRAARDILAEVARFGPGDEDRAKALYLLGEHYFFLERYAESAPDGEPVSGTALYYWEILKERYPDSPWSERSARPLRYVRLVSSREVPEFQSTFEAADGSVTYSRDELRGKVGILDFWRSSAPGQKDRETRLAADLSLEFRKSPVLRDKVVVLGVNLDSDRATYETARSRWEIPWPQIHDGQGFQTPLANAFAIPRVPHRVLIDPQGRLAYLGSDEAAFRAVLATELAALSSDAGSPQGASEEAPPPAQESGSEAPSPDGGGSSEEPSSGASGGR